MFFLFKKSEELPEEDFQAKTFYTYLEREFEYEEINSIVLKVLDLHIQTIEKDTKTVRKVICENNTKFRAVQDVLQMLKDKL